MVIFMGRHFIHYHLATNFYAKMDFPNILEENLLSDLDENNSISNVHLEKSGIYFSTISLPLPHESDGSDAKQITVRGYLHTEDYLTNISVDKFLDHQHVNKEKSQMADQEMIISEIILSSSSSCESTPESDVSRKFRPALTVAESVSEPKLIRTKSNMMEAMSSSALECDVQSEYEISFEELVTGVLPRAEYTIQTSDLSMEKKDSHLENMTSILTTTEENLKTEFADQLGQLPDNRKTHDDRDGKEEEYLFHGNSVLITYCGKIDDVPIDCSPPEPGSSSHSYTPLPPHYSVASPRNEHLKTKQKNVLQRAWQRLIGPIRRRMRRTGAKVGVAGPRTLPPLKESNFTMRCIPCFYTCEIEEEVDPVNEMIMFIRYCQMFQKKIDLENLQLMMSNYENFCQDLGRTFYSNLLEMFLTNGN